MSTIKRRIERLEAILGASEPEAPGPVDVKALAAAMDGAQAQLDRDPGDRRARALATLGQALERMAADGQLAATA